MSQNAQHLEANLPVLTQAAAQARGLAIDAVHACSSGHLGLPLGCAEIGSALFSYGLSFNPKNPAWLNRDRFILSAGHGSMFIYSWLHLAGYEISLEDVKSFRKLHSKTPGHPEFREAPGIESTTGPLGQGVGNAVGMAVAAKFAEANFNTEAHTILDHHIVALAGDGCLQEGVAREAVAFAGHQKLDNLILIYDSNDVTLDAMADQTQSEDTAKLYEALGWEVQTIDGHDMKAFLAAFDAAKASSVTKPKMIIAKTEIGRGIPEVAGTAGAHGEGGAKFAEEARKGLGLPEGGFYVSDEVKAFFAKRAEERASAEAEWNSTYEAWAAANPEKAAQLTAMQKAEVPSADELFAAIPEFEADKELATRASGGAVLNAIAAKMPLLITGSADLFGSTKNYIKDVGDFCPANRSGRNIRFGIREHAMGAIVNGMSYWGLLGVSGATFLSFADYMRASVRLASLSKLSNFQIFTHDSVGVGEDGPTHQPVEQTSAMRLIPDLDVIRPGDAEETAGAFVAAVTNTSGPTNLILSRQNLPNINCVSAKERREGVLKGGYVAKKETAALETILIACGSELQHAMAAAEELGAGTRVVSLPSMHRFDKQSAEYQESVLPAACSKRVAIEAGVDNLWYKYVGLGGKVVGVNRFGLSAPGDTVMKEVGITKEAVIEAAKAI